MEMRARDWARTIGLIAAAALVPGTAASAQSASRCEWLDKPGMSAVVICPPGSSEADWRAAGRAACADSGPCHAWIWTDRNKAPRKPIAPDSPLTGEQLEAARALWVDYTQTLYFCGGVWC